MKLIACTFFLTFSFFPLAQPQQRKTGSPIDELPANIEVLTTFGERADFSPDNK